MMIRYRCIGIAFILMLCSGILPAAQAPVPESLQDLALLKQDSNPARLEAIKTLLQKREMPFELETFTSNPTLHGRTKGINLLMSFGKSPKDIIVGAHYDAVEAREGGLTGGMVDNGANVIILIRLANALKKQTLHHRIRVVLFDMEEVGLLGSKAYIAAHKTEIAAGVNLDIAGMGSVIAYAPGKAEGTAHIQKAIGLACSEQKLSCMEFPNFPPSDDRSFQAADLPAVSIAFIPPLQSIDKIQSLMKVLHTPDDTIDKIDPATLDPIAQGMLNIILKLDALLE